MPLTYSTPQVVESKKAESIHCVQVVIRTPRNGDATVEYAYEAVDADGNIMRSVSYTELVSTIMTEQPDDAAAVAAFIKARAYANAEKAGFPAGGILT